MSTLNAAVYVSPNLAESLSIIKAGTIAVAYIQLHMGQRDYIEPEIAKQLGRIGCQVKHVDLYRTRNAFEHDDILNGLVRAGEVALFIGSGNGQLIEAAIRRGIFTMVLEKSFVGAAFIQEKLYHLEKTLQQEKNLLVELKTKYRGIEHE